MALSGGVDSTFLAKIVEDYATKSPVAVTISTEFGTEAEVDYAKDMARSIGIDHEIPDVKVLDHPKIANNDIKRCYYCKKIIFEEIIKYGNQFGDCVIFDGTIVDDMDEYRPGLQALEDLEIISPLRDFGFNKNDVRQISRDLGLDVHDKPSSPCLATRLPYNKRVNLDLLAKIEHGEELLKDLGFVDCRLRVHDNIARIEVPVSEFENLLDNRDKLLDLKDLGFDYITLDIEGLRSGSMDL